VIESPEGNALPPEAKGKGVLPGAQVKGPALLDQAQDLGAQPAAFTRRKTDNGNLLHDATLSLYGLLGLIT